MSRKIGSVEGKASALVKTMYIIAAVLAVIFVYMVVVNILYIVNYAVSYGMVFTDMWMDAIQYVITGSISYLTYSVVVFGIGKIMRMMQKNNLAVATEHLNEPGGSDSEIISDSDLSKSEDAGQEPAVIESGEHQDEAEDTNEDGKYDLKL